MWWLYNFLLTITFPIWGTWMWWRTRARAEAPNWAERRGAYPFQLSAKDRTVWIHAVSVGEVVASIPILKELRKQDPSVKIVLTTTTSSGYKTANEQANELVDRIAYFPIDVFLFQMSGMTHVRPKVVAVMETELWFNFLEAAKLMRAKTLLLNGRISDRSYPRALKLQFFYASLFKRVDRCLVQTQVDADRITALGGRNVHVLGNSKFDEALAPAKESAEVWRERLGISSSDFVVVIGSTRSEDEEHLVVSGLSKLDKQGLKIIHAPRHLERANALSEIVRTEFDDVALRSKGEHGQYLILDTYGELGDVYALANVAVIGGGFSNLGGQNLIQPMAMGKPVIHGPHMQNFAAVAKAGHDCGATITVDSAESLAAAINSLRSDPERARAMGDAARDFVQGHAGASARYAAAILEALNTE
jgi:3-deoxy-D-manno-octulosonic-acid transferase